MGSHVHVRLASPGRHAAPILTSARHCHASMAVRVWMALMATHVYVLLDTQAQHVAPTLTNVRRCHVRMAGRVRIESMVILVHVRTLTTAGKGRCLPELYGGEPLI